MDHVKKQTLLCVDDDKKNLELLEALLSPFEYELQFSESGEDALKQVAQRVPDLILLDIMMPSMTGFEVLERLRSAEATRLTPVVLLTALNDEKDIIKGFDKGCDDFISKPFNETELIARVRSLLRISYYRKTLDEKEKFWHVVFSYVTSPMIVCGPDWSITNLNQAAQRFLMPGTEFEDVNFLVFLCAHYNLSVPWDQLTDCKKAPQKFKIEKKDTERSAIQHAEVSLEIFENSVREVMNIVVTLRDVAEGTDKKE
jgi:two-component system, cell cycle response regulator